MALTPNDEIHALQIQAGVLGRKTGHAFEYEITQAINSLSYPFKPLALDKTHLFHDEPAKHLLSYVAIEHKVKTIRNATAIATGALATSEEGKRILSIDGSNITRCKSDLIITIHTEDDRTYSVGISTKQCNTVKPTNAQIYLTTAQSFGRLLNQNGIKISAQAINALRQFCGDIGFRPSDFPNENCNRKIDSRRYFWEEISSTGRDECEDIFRIYQDDITRILFQKAYLNDPFTPEFVLHKTKKTLINEKIEVAIYSIDELVSLSRKYKGFAKRPYTLAGVSHDAPRFGIIQMQRFGPKQNAAELQFNLEAGYFYKI